MLASSLFVAVGVVWYSRQAVSEKQQLTTTPQSTTGSQLLRLCFEIWRCRGGRFSEGFAATCQLRCSSSLCVSHLDGIRDVSEALFKLWLFAEAMFQHWLFESIWLSGFDVFRDDSAARCQLRFYKSILSLLLVWRLGCVLSHVPAPVLHVTLNR